MDLLDLKLKRICAGLMGFNMIRRRYRKANLCFYTGTEDAEEKEI